MTELNPQFYDQLAKRLDRQDSQLDRIETNQATTLECLQKQKSAHAEHLASDKANFKWLAWIIGGAWTAIGTIAAFLFHN